MRKENTSAIQPLPEMFLLWEWIFSAGPLQKSWSSPLEPTDPRHFCSFCLFCFQTQSAPDPRLGLDTAPRSVGAQGTLCRLGQKSWTHKCCSAPFLITIYLHSKIRGSVSMRMPHLLASSSARNEYLKHLHCHLFVCWRCLTEVQFVLFQYL